jgi:hypothetical protein
VHAVVVQQLTAVSHRFLSPFVSSFFVFSSFVSLALLVPSSLLLARHPEIPSCPVAFSLPHHHIIIIIIVTSRLGLVLVLTYYHLLERVCNSTSPQTYACPPVLLAIYSVLFVYLPRPDPLPFPPLQSPGARHSLLSVSVSVSGRLRVDCPVCESILLLPSPTQTPHPRLIQLLFALPRRPPSTIARSKVLVLRRFKNSKHTHSHTHTIL